MVELIPTILNYGLFFSMLGGVFYFLNAILKGKKGLKPEKAAYNEVLALKTGTIDELKQELRSLKSKAWNKDNKMDKTVAGQSDTDGGILADLFEEIAPDAIKRLIPADAVRKHLEENPEIVTAFVERAKQRFKNGSTQGEPEGDGL